MTRARTAVLAASLLALLVALVALVRACPRAVTTSREAVGLVAGEVPTIEAGRERDVLALLAPHALGGFPLPGWRLMRVQIEPHSITCGLDGPGGRTATLTLRHPDHARAGAARTASFATTTEVSRPPDPEGARALALLAAAIRANDRGGFFRITRPAALGTAERVDTPVGRAAGLAGDGIVHLALLALVLAMLVARALRDEPRGAARWLLAIALAGALLRLALAVPTTMDVWPYTRLLALPRRVFDGPVLAWLTAALHRKVYLTDVILGLDTAMALAAPLAVFPHARALLRDGRSALLACALLALLPVHIRFSRSDSGFIPSTVLASMAFALVHQSLRDPSRAWRVAALVCVPPVVVATLDQRILNVMFIGLYLQQIWTLHPPEVPRARRAWSSAVVVATGAAVVFGGFLAQNGAQIEEGLSARVLLNALEAAVTPRWNTLIHPRVTPPGLLALALYGAVALWRARERALLAFLLVWPALFFCANAIILPHTVEMQARYHLHLAVPFVLLAARGLRALLERLRGRRAWVAAVGGYLLAMPLMHLGFVRDVGFNDMREYDFVRAQRGRLPPGCTVLEFTAPNGPRELRFARVGAAVADGARVADVRAVSFVDPAPPPGDPFSPTVRRMLASPPACLALYVGLVCYSEATPGRPIAPACEAAARELPLEPVASARFDNRPYDENVMRAAPPPASIELRLARVRVDRLPRPR